MTLQNLLFQERIRVQKEADVKIEAQARIYKARIDLLKSTLRDLVPALDNCKDEVSVSNVKFILAQDDSIEKDLEADENEKARLLRENI